MVRLSAPTVKLYPFYLLNHSVLRCLWMLPFFFPASYPTYYDLCWLLKTPDYITITVCYFGIRAYLRQLIFRPLRVSLIAFLSCSLCIYIHIVRVMLDFDFYCNLIPIWLPPMQFLFVSSRVCRKLPSDSTLRWTPLLLTNTAHYHVCSGLAPYSY